MGACEWKSHFFSGKFATVYCNHKVTVHTVVLKVSFDTPDMTVHWWNISIIPEKVVLCLYYVNKALNLSLIFNSYGYTVNTIFHAIVILRRINKYTMWGMNYFYILINEELLENKLINFKLSQWSYHCHLKSTVQQLIWLSGYCLKLFILLLFY